MYIPNNKMNDYFSKRCISHKILNFTTGFQVYQIEYMKSLLSPSSPSSELDVVQLLVTLCSTARLIKVLGIMQVSQAPCVLMQLFTLFEGILDTLSHLILLTTPIDHTKQMTSFSLNTKSHNRVLTLLLNSEASLSRYFNKQDLFELLFCPVSLVALCPCMTSGLQPLSKEACLPSKR